MPQDEASELMHGKVYKALTTSRWDSPEMVAVFADTMRRKEILTKTNLAFKNVDTFRQDLNLIRDASAADFEALEGYATLGQAFVGQKGKQNPRAFAALKSLMLTTSTVALTEGNKMKLRHFGHALNLYCGSLKLFLTCNFADTYCPLTLVLYDEENQECLAERKMNLFESVPAMPTLQDMHKIVAKSPRTQARLFLIMEQFVITESLCIQNAFIGTAAINSPEMPGSMIRACEDHMASSGEPGLADFAETLLSPLEAQGRGFSHAQKKSVAFLVKAQPK